MASSANQRFCDPAGYAGLAVNVIVNAVPGGIRPAGKLHWIAGQPPFWAVHTPEWLVPPTVRATFLSVVVAVSSMANTCSAFVPLFVACTVSACGDEPCV